MRVILHSKLSPHPSAPARLPTHARRACCAPKHTAQSCLEPRPGRAAASSVATPGCAAQAGDSLCIFFFITKKKERERARGREWFYIRRAPLSLYTTTHMLCINVDLDGPNQCAPYMRLNKYTRFPLCTRCNRELNRLIEGMVQGESTEEGRRTISAYVEIARHGRANQKILRNIMRYVERHELAEAVVKSCCE